MQQTPSQSRCEIKEKPALGLCEDYKPALCCSGAPELLQCYIVSVLQCYSVTALQCDITVTTDSTSSVW